MAIIKIFNWKHFKLHILTSLSFLIEKFYFLSEKRLINPALDLRKMPFVMDRRGCGSLSYGEWCYNAGIFRSLIYENLKTREAQVLDVGCGTGLMAIASHSFLTHKNSQFVGIDVKKESINFCQKRYNWPNFQFVHLPDHNAHYAPQQKPLRQKWPVKEESVDLATAVSVWTHFNEADALFYIQELARVLKKGARAMVTFFILDDEYYKNINNANSYINKMNLTFSIATSPSRNWFTTSWAKVPESATAINGRGLELIKQKSNFKIIKIYNGHWKKGDLGVDGLHLQDIVIFEK